MTPADLRAKALELIQAAIEDAHTELPPEPRDSHADLTAFVEALCAVAEASKQAQRAYGPDPVCDCGKCRTFRPISVALSRLEELAK